MPKIGRFKNEASKQAYESIYRELEGTWPVPSTQLDVPTSFGTTHIRRSGTGPARRRRSSCCTQSAPIVCNGTSSSRTCAETESFMRWTRSVLQAAVCRPLH